jgi:hypothetical protein
LSRVQDRGERDPASEDMPPARLKVLSAGIVTDFAARLARESGDDQSCSLIARKASTRPVL